VIHEISIDVKVNYGEKKNVAYMEDDIDLSCLAANLPDWITRRVLWRVTQSQYDPLGLLCIYIAKWKLLMREVTIRKALKARKVSWRRTKKKISRPY
jgi:hypothetical protein